MGRERSHELRIAIAGLGPKGLFALERLLSHLATADLSARVQVEAFEPHPVPGAGPVYDPAQPDYLRMNFSAEQVDVWPAESQAAPASRQLAFVAWRERSEGALVPDFYPPRGQVGRYLATALSTLIEHAPPGVDIAVHRERVVAARPEAWGWRIWSEKRTDTFDEVLIATGHAASWSGALSRDWSDAVPLVEGVFPVDRQLATDRIPSGARVAARGFALTFIDAALALTEGRGGTFEVGGDGSRLRYRPSGAEPATVFPFSRTGKPMLPKPGADAVRASPRWRAAAAAQRARVLALPVGFTIDSDLTPILTALAAYAPYAGGENALGSAWRAIYPAIVERLGGDGLDDRQWPGFRALAVRMERLAFGPPPINVAKLEALIACGLVDLSHVAGGTVETTDGSTALRSEFGTTPIDLVLDAVLPPPGVLGIESPLLEGLLGDGHVRVRPDRRGLEVGADATCIARDGEPCVGLAACGRPTEDSVIGNDTLSRVLHPQLAAWAARIASSRAVLAGAPKT